MREWRCVSGRNGADVGIWGKHARSSHVSHMGGRTELIHRVLRVWTSVGAWVLLGVGVGYGWRLVRIDAVWTAMLGAGVTLAGHEGGKVLRGSGVGASLGSAGGWYRDAVWLGASADDWERHLDRVT